MYGNQAVEINVLEHTNDGLPKMQKKVKNYLKKYCQSDIIFSSALE